MNPNDHMDMTIVRQSVYAYIQSNSESLFLASELSGWEDLYMFRDRVERIWVAEIRESLSYDSPIRPSNKGNEVSVWLTFISWAG